MYRYRERGSRHDDNGGDGNNEEADGDDNGSDGEGDAADDDADGDGGEDEDADGDDMAEMMRIAMLIVAI